METFIKLFLISCWGSLVRGVRTF